MSSGDTNAKRKRLSEPMVRVLRNLRAGRPYHDGCRGMARFGALTGTMAALRRRGLVTEQGYTLTAAGRIALVEEENRRGTVLR